MFLKLISNLINYNQNNLLSSLLLEESLFSQAVNLNDFRGMHFYGFTTYFLNIFYVELKFKGNRALLWI